MKSSGPYFRNFPENFLKETTDEILRVLRRGNNIQLTGIKGSGKSLLLHAIHNKPEFTDEYEIYMVDFNLINGYSVQDFTALITEETGDSLKKELSEGKKVLFLMDSIDYAYKKIPECLNLLKGIGDKYRDYVSFVFTMDSPLPDQPFLGQKINMKPLRGSDLEWFWKGIGGVDKFKEKIFRASGGFIALIKRLNEIAESGDLEGALENPRAYPHLNYQLELIREGIKAGNSSGNIPIYEVFVQGHRPKELTKLEFKAFNFLQANPGVVIEREDLINTIWGETSNTDISDHALDQLVHRLKKKTGGRYKIHTLRGRGYRLD